MSEEGELVFRKQENVSQRKEDCNMKDRGSRGWRRKGPHV